MTLTLTLTLTLALTLTLILTLTTGAPARALGNRRARRRAQSECVAWPALGVACAARPRWALRRSTRSTLRGLARRAAPV